MILFCFKNVNCVLNIKSAALRVSKLFSEAQINLQAFGIGLSIKGVPPISDIEEALKKMLKSIKKQNKRVLVTIDEATNSKEIRIFVSTYQIFCEKDCQYF